MTKGKKKLFYLILIFGFIALIYKLLPFNIEYIGFKHKIYAHRVNSLEKLESALKYFEGIELDLVYNQSKNKLDVNHPPTASIGLSFETYLSKINTENQPKLWLDIKNLDTTNHIKIYSKLVSLLKRNNYKFNRILIETSQPEALNVFSNDFKLTYYLPILIHQKPQQEQDSIISLIHSKLKKQPDLGLSLQYDDYQLISSKFPLVKKHIYAIPNGLKFKQLEVRKRLKDTTVDVLITPFRSLKGNR